MTLNSYLNSKGHRTFEGYSQQVPQQMIDLKNLTTTPNINIMEIGFNGGHSAEIFLSNNLNLTLTSFDLGIHDYVKIGKEYIDMTYPNRHTLILGDSQETIPQYLENNKDTKFDFIFIDGGHEYDIVKNDMINCQKLSHSETIVALDDTIFNNYGPSYTIGPTKIWTEYIQDNKIIELNRKQYNHGRGMTWGKYL